MRSVDGPRARRILAKSLMAKLVNVNEEIADLADLLVRGEEPRYKPRQLDLRALDYSLESLLVIHNYLLVIRKEKISKDTFLPLLLRIGAYVGETVRRAKVMRQPFWCEYAVVKQHDDLLLIYTPRSLVTSFMLVFPKFGGKDIQGLAWPVQAVDEYFRHKKNVNIVKYTQWVLAEFPDEDTSPRPNRGKLDQRRK